MSAVGFGIRFGLIILENQGIDHKIMRVAWVHPGIEMISLIILYMEWKSALSQNLTHSSPHFTC